MIKNQKNPEKNPNLFVDGPFGEAHQDYSNYEVGYFCFSPVALASAIMNGFIVDVVHGMARVWKFELPFQLF